MKTLKMINVCALCSLWLYMGACTTDDEEVQLPTSQSVPTELPETRGFDIVIPLPDTGKSNYLLTNLSYLQLSNGNMNLTDKLECRYHGSPLTASNHGAVITSAQFDPTVSMGGSNVRSTMRISFSTNNTSQIRRDTVEVWYDGSLYRYQKFEQQPVMSVVWAYSNVYFDGGSLNFATNAGSVPADAQGVVFKFGSLMAITPGGFSHGHDEVVALYSNDNIHSWSDITCYDFDGYSNVSGYDVESGKGDICRYINNSWRLPTAAECENLINRTKVAYGNFASGSYNDPWGTDRVYSGWFFNTNSGSSSYLTGSMPSGVVFIPAAGSLDATDGAYMGNAGSNGYLWTSTVDSMGNGKYLQLDAYGVNVESAVRESGFSVRCVRNK